MQVIRHYVQELINHAIVADKEFAVSWGVFDLQFPELQKEYLERARMLKATLEHNIEVDGNVILWLLTQKEMTILADAISRLNWFFKHILMGDPVYMTTPDEITPDDPRWKFCIAEDKVLRKAAIYVESSYGRKAGTEDNAIGKWTPITELARMDWSIGTLTSVLDAESGNMVVRGSPEGELYRFGGIDYVKTRDVIFLDQVNGEIPDNTYADSTKRYFIKDGDQYLELQKGIDYSVGDIISHYGVPVYEQTSIYDFEREDPKNPSTSIRGGAELYPAYIDLTVTEDNPALLEQLLAGQRLEGVSKEDNPKSILPAKFGHRQAASIFQTFEPVEIEFIYGSYELTPDGIYKFHDVEVTNIVSLNDRGTALFKYDPTYDWEKDLVNNGTITSNLHVRRLVKGWFGHGQPAWTRDINSLPYIQTLDEHDWTRMYKTHCQRYIQYVTEVDARDLLHLVNGNPSKVYLFFIIGNLLAVRHELLCIYFRALNAIRKKGLYSI